MTTAEKGTKVRVHYRGTLNDGTEFDNSHTRVEPIEFQVVAGQMILGFDSAVVGMSVGDSKTITLAPEEAYGTINPEAKTEIPKNAFPEGLDLVEGMPVPLGAPDGRRVMGRLTQLNEETVTVDLNHPLAGEALNFDIELVEVTTE